MKLLNIVIMLIIFLPFSVLPKGEGSIVGGGGIADDSNLINPQGLIGGGVSLFLISRFDHKYESMNDLGKIKRSYGKKLENKSTLQIKEIS